MIRKLDYEIVYKYLRKKDFGIITTLSKTGYPHTTGVLYAISDFTEDLKFFIITGKKYQKTKNIMNDSKISFVIPFPHYIMRFVPPPMIQFEGNAELVEYDNNVHERLFMRTRGLKTNLDFIDSNPDNIIVIEITPNNKIHGHGIGIGMLELKKHHAQGAFYSLIK